MASWRLALAVPGSLPTRTFARPIIFSFNLGVDVLAGDVMAKNESHFASLALKHVSQTPALCAAAADAQIEATAVSMETRLHLRHDFARGQPVELVCHGCRSTICGLGGDIRRSSVVLNRPRNPTKFPASICGIIANGGGCAQMRSRKKCRKIQPF